MQQMPQSDCQITFEAVLTCHFHLLEEITDSVVWMCYCLTSPWSVCVTVLLHRGLGVLLFDFTVVWVCYCLTSLSSGYVTV